MNCPTCNTQNHTTSKFCYKCGASMNKTVSLQMTECPSCRMMFDRQPRFCENCGYQFATNPKANIAPPNMFSRKWKSIFGTFAGLWFLLFLVSLRYMAPTP